MKRRTVVGTMGAGLVWLAGCLSGGSGSDGDSPKDDTGSPTGTADGDDSLTDWERSTVCERDPDRMYDSVVRVERVTSSLEDEYAPIEFSDLTDDEQAILREVTDEGGYGTCDASEAFHRFVDRVGDATERQDGDDQRVYLERDGTFYGLYVEVADQVYAY